MLHFLKTWQQSKLLVFPLSLEMWHNFLPCFQGEGENRGHSDGSYLGTEYFKCKPNCGIFLPFSRIQFIPTLDNDHGKQKPKVDAEEVVPVKVGDAVSFYVDNVRRKGIAMAVYREGTQWFVKVCPVRAASLSFPVGFFFILLFTYLIVCLSV